MSGFTSGKISHDPRPMSSAQTPEYRHARYSDCSTRCIFDPRPEFDHHNPILAAYRKYSHHGPTLWLRDTEPARIAAGSMSALVGIVPWELGQNHIDHARRVLTKLAALMAVSS